MTPFAAALDRIYPFVGHEQSKQLSRYLIPKERLWIGYELCILLGEGALFEMSSLDTIPWSV